MVCAAPVNGVLWEFQVEGSVQTYVLASVPMDWYPSADPRSEAGKTGCHPMQVVVAAMRKLLHLAFGVLKSGEPFNPKLGVA